MKTSYKLSLLLVYVAPFFFSFLYHSSLFHDYSYRRHPHKFTNLLYPDNEMNADIATTAFYCTFFTLRYFCTVSWELLSRLEFRTIFSVFGMQVIVMVLTKLYVYLIRQSLKVSSFIRTETGAVVTAQQM